MKINLFQYHVPAIAGGLEMYATFHKTMFKLTDMWQRFRYGYIFSTYEDNSLDNRVILPNLVCMYGCFIRSYKIILHGIC